MRAQTSSTHGDDESLKPHSILLIYSVIDTIKRGEPNNLIADVDTIETAQAMAIALRAGGYQLTTAPIRSLEDVKLAVAGIDTQTTLVFNLCESLGGVSISTAEVPRLLDKLGVYYTGATAENTVACFNKDFTKQCLLKRGVSTAPYQVFYTGQEPITVPLPAIVKPVAEDCSMGINGNSVVHNALALRQQVAYILEVYQQPALVEMFLDGREFSVSVWGNGVPHVLGIGEVIYEDSALRVDNFEAKWSNRFRAVYPAPLDSHAEVYIGQLGLAAYKTMGCRDYGRVDLREKDGQVYVLEVNENPCLAVGAGFVNAARVAGYDYVKMACQLVEWAWWRNQHE